jgi:hypothetical protein
MLVVLLSVFIPSSWELVRTSACLLGLAFIANALVRPGLSRFITWHQLRVRRGKSELELHADLFELRTAVLEKLAANDFIWLSDFGAVDLVHDIYGLEVTAIQTKELAVGIARVLAKMFPSPDSS